MNRYLQQRLAELIAQYDTAVLATCGHAGPQVSSVICHVEEQQFYLLIPHTSDHLFNLETQRALVLLTPHWKLQGTGCIVEHHPDIPAQTWQRIVQIIPVRIHILAADGTAYIETIDFEGSERDSQ